MKPLFVLRPEPGANKTAAKARALGLDVAVRPLFEVRPLDWEFGPQSSYEAIFITSSNSLKCMKEKVDILREIPVLCVGASTAEAAQEAGFENVTSGNKDASSLADLAASLGYRHLLWLRGRPSRSIEHPDLNFDVQEVYETVALEWSGEESAMLSQSLVALLHSPRAAQRFGELAANKGAIDIVAISEKAAIAAGPGWASVHWPVAPSDDAMLEIAAPLCRAG